ncbi:ABC transporter permease [Vibrio sp. CK2-1]|uniref:ABC transporter permease n=1 Tax=Vibrio sp. CK2-1 TaxID=2912249 RepID=UPI001F0304F6|nr:ABC transporter permease [Vibrio sp. CK2-1]MCF7355618.1 ABC transporter permease [Vibrio sp. CK2-1]
MNTKAISRNLYILYTLAHLKKKANIRGTFLGYLWWIIEPMMLIALYSYIVGVIFGHRGADQILMIGIGVTLWKWWSSSMSISTTSFRRYKGIVCQVKIPLPILPTSEVFGESYMFCFAYLLLQTVLLFFGYTPDLFALALTFAITMISISAISLFLAILNVFVRDTAFLVGFGLRILFYVTPIIYPPSRVPENYRFLIELNPFAHLIGFYNNALIYNDKIIYSHMLYALVLSSLALIILMRFCKRITPQIIRNV